MVHGSTVDRDEILATWLGQHTDGVTCVIGDSAYPHGTRIHSLTPELAKGLEFDLVVLVNPDEFGTGIEGAVDRMWR